MGLESRDYARDGSYTARLAGWGMEPFTPAVKYLIILNVIVFLAQIFVTRSKPDDDVPDEVQESISIQRDELAKLERDLAKLEAEGKDDDDAKLARRKKQQEIRLREKALEQIEQYLPVRRVSIVQEWFELDPAKVRRGEVWRLLTCAFCHDTFGVWHIVFNMVLLYWFGTRIEHTYGSREFLCFYLMAALCGSAAYVALAWYTGSKSSAIGASGAVMGVMMLYVIFYPFETYMLFWFIPVPLWVMLSLYVLYDVHPVLLALAGNRITTGVAHAGHLGGLLFGFVYWRFGLRLESVFGQRWKGTRVPRRRAAERPKPAAEPKILSFPRPDALAERVDEVLKKISEHGKESLTDEEREVLIQASAKYRGRKP